MRGVDLMTFLGGLGVFLFSLRFLTGVLERTITNRFRPILAPALATPARAFAAGFAVTGLVQASSITLIAAMGLVSATAITLEQGLFLMLGATLGTTLKFWVFAGHLALGRVFVGVGSLGWVILRSPVAREALELVLAAGFALLGLEMMGQGIAPLAAHPEFMRILAAHDGGRLKSQLFLALVGCVCTTALQSSSAMLFTAMTFAAQGVITVPAGAALVLGANVGTTATALMASLQMDWRARRLAIAHALVKATGAGVALFFFPTFVGFVERFASFAAEPSGAVRIAIAHTLFNVLNVAAWVAGAGLLVRVLRAVTPEESTGGLALPPVVRRMLASSPERALVETKRQLDRLRQLTKAQLDECVTLLVKPGAEVDAAPLVVRSFESVREGLQELIVQLTRSSVAQAQGEHLARLMAVVDACHALHEDAVGLRMLAVRGRVDGFTPPEAMRERLEALARALDGRWLQVVFPNATPEPLSPVSAAAALQDGFPEHARSAAVRIEALVWLQEALARLVRLALRLDELLDAEQRMRGEVRVQGVVREGR